MDDSGCHQCWVPAFSAALRKLYNLVGTIEKNDYQDVKYNYKHHDDDDDDGDDVKFKKEK